MVAPGQGRPVGRVAGPFLVDATATATGLVDGKGATVVTLVRLETRVEGAVVLVGRPRLNGKVEVVGLTTVDAVGRVVARVPVLGHLGLTAPAVPRPDVTALTRPASVRVTSTVATRGLSPARRPPGTPRDGVLTGQPGVAFDEMGAPVRGILAPAGREVTGVSPVPVGEDIQVAPLAGPTTRGRGVVVARTGLLAVMVAATLATGTAGRPLVIRPSVEGAPTYAV